MPATGRRKLSWTCTASLLLPPLPTPSEKRLTRAARPTPISSYKPSPACPPCASGAAESAGGLCFFAPTIARGDGDSATAAAAAAVAAEATSRFFRLTALLIATSELVKAHVVI